MRRIHHDRWLADALHEDYPMRDRHSRQSFLGADSEQILRDLTVGVVGLGGGGSHIVQQLAHIGVGALVIADPDHVEDSNLNRLVGATANDVKEATLKTLVAERLALAINPHMRIVPVSDRWQEGHMELRGCAFIFGCVDSWSEREQLERFARRFLVPYIDIGMDVHDLGDGEFTISGQVFLSMPGQPCLRCAGILTDDLLSDEAQRYGAAGAKPQVIWPNGILASAAVGLFMQLFTPWHSGRSEIAYLEYDGDNQALHSSPLAEIIRKKKCDHFNSSEVGDPLFEDHPHAT
jgi:molybdopterin/thiamine biosynthesis adenylyltransferase